MFCSNCEGILDEQIESDRFEIDMDEEGIMGSSKTPHLVTIREAVSLIFNKNGEKQTLSSVPALRMCHDCIQVLSELYILFTLFKKRTTKTSHLQHLLTYRVESVDYDAVSDTQGEIKEEEIEDIMELHNEWIPNFQDERNEWDDENYSDHYEVPRGLRNVTGSRPLYNSKKNESKSKGEESRKEGDENETSGDVQKIESEFTRISSRIVFNQSKIEKSRVPILRLVKLPSTLVVPHIVKGSESDQESSTVESREDPQSIPIPRIRSNRIRICNKSTTNSNLPPIPLECNYGCQETFKTRNHLALHLKSAHNERKKYQCQMCPKIYLKKSSLVDHVQLQHVDLSVEDEKLTRCPVCHKVCVTKKYLWHHLHRVHVAHEAGECVDCKKIFQNRFFLEIHLKRHAVEMDIRSRRNVCPDCGISFHYKSRLKRHIEFVHLKKMKYVCEQCGHKSSCPSALRDHQLSHQPNRERNFPCTICDLKFYSAYTAQKHILTHQPDGSNSLCNYCGKTLSTPGSLQRHVQTRHCDIPEVALTRRTLVFPCTICGKEFKHRDYLAQHLQSKGHGGPGFRKKS